MTVAAGGAPLSTGRQEGQVCLQSKGDSVQQLVITAIKAQGIACCLLELGIIAPQNQTCATAAMTVIVDPLLSSGD